MRKNTITKAHTVGGQQTTGQGRSQSQAKARKGSPFGVSVPLDRIAVDAANNTRKRVLTERELNELGESLRLGQLQPCLGLIRPDGKIDLKVGFRRYAAANKLGLPTLWVEEYQGSESEAILSNLAENTARSDLTPAEKAKGFARSFDVLHGLQPKLGVSKIDEIIAARCGVSREQVTQYRLFAQKLAPEVFAAWEENPRKLQTKWLQTITNLGKRAQNEALDAKLTGRTALHKDGKSEPGEAAKATRVTRARLEALQGEIAKGEHDGLGAKWIEGAAYMLGFVLGQYDWAPSPAGDKGKR